MRSGVRFSEVYTDPDAEVRLIEQAFGWRPSEHGGDADSMYSYLTTLTQEVEHGGAFRYRSCETDVLGWVCERASGIPMAAMISHRIWSRLGAEHDAEVCCDATGAAIHDGGVCAGRRSRSVRASASPKRCRRRSSDRAGRMAARSVAVDSDVRTAFAESEAEPHMPGGWYRNQFWFCPRTHGDVMLCLGIYGQMVYVNPATRLARGEGVLVAGAAIAADARERAPGHRFDRRAALRSTRPHALRPCGYRLPGSRVTRRGAPRGVGPACMLRDRGREGCGNGSVELSRAAPFTATLTPGRRARGSGREGGGTDRG